ncbi:DUF1326 domain-containing protein [Azohydromonas australica]|uniref:DUF1326 domain-containing protein n=1 Tax=Azohydromonas australica TaxID=364039 RepID=UPI00048C3030|nr:DUF1326 domain-containing protein [Azohydromonas australica]
MATWSVEGEYMETCNCAFVCPCITSNLAAQPTEGDCKAAIALRIDKGQNDGVALDGLAFIVVMHAPAAMGEGNITVGLIVDDRASDAQLGAITAIASGAAGGPMAALAPLIGRFAGVQRRSIQFEIDGLKRSVQAGELVDQACEGIPSAVAPGDAIVVDNTVHPVNRRLSLAKATRSSLHAFGIEWDDVLGDRNAHFAPFSWSG